MSLNFERSFQMKYKDNILLNTDSYKNSHFLGYPDGTEYVYSYIESRGGKFDKTLFFGLQAFMKEYMETPITKAMIDQAEMFYANHGEPFNRAGWEYILNAHKGKLPLQIYAVPEGTMVPTGVPLVTVLNSDPECAWLTSFVETMLLRGVWYPTTVATQSKYIKKMISYYLEKTGDSSLINFKLHDFGARGVSSQESAAIGGMAHLVNFMGTDTVSGILAAQEYYGPADQMMGYSIPAAEHSTMTILGKEGEVKQMQRMIDQFAKPGALFAVVSDSYDIAKACKTWGTTFKQQLIDSGATLVVRPDSGDPVETSLKVVKILNNYFGSVMNSKGYRVLNTVRVIYGDGINYESIKEILETFKINGYSADSIAFGMGGALLQGINRDTQKFAMKASAARVNGKWIDVYKEAPGKNSKKGRVMAYKSRLTGEWCSIGYSKGVADEWIPQMEMVYLNGKVVREQTFDEVRSISNQ